MSQLQEGQYDIDVYKRQLLRSTINDQLLTLEIISHTPILTIQGEKDVQETTIQEQEENKRQSKKKDKKE